jgi:UDP-N-acetylmuramyl pentapeptide phosphotransferase/UDP-N-acetylglucosamine-1-phosphate transferase
LLYYFVFNVFQAKLPMSIYSPFVSALIAFALSHFLLSNKATNKLQDLPNERSLHSTPVPRVGGVALMAGVLCGWILVFDTLVWWVVLPLMVLFALSLLDDIYNLPVKQRLLVHLLAAFVLVGGSSLYVQQGVLIALIVLLLTVWMTNLYNFMDGSNGLAGGMAMFGFAMYGIASLFADNMPLAWLNFCIAAAAAGFLYFNFHPAKIFMGDSGSIPLGFLVAAMGLLGWQQGSWAAWFPLLVFSPFIVDASVTLVKRTVRGVKITEAHREHYYQRLIMLGWGHRKVALLEYALMIAVGVSALSMQHKVLPWLLILVWAFIYTSIMLWIDRRWKNFNRGKHA